MPDAYKPSAKEQRIVDLRQKIKGGVSANNLPDILEEIVDILQGQQGEDEYLREAKQDKIGGIDPGTA